MYEIIEKESRDLVLFTSDFFDVEIFFETEMIEYYDVYFNGIALRSIEQQTGLSEQQ
jgi:hypothetical protein